VIASGLLAVAIAAGIFLLVRGRGGRHHSHADTASIHAGGIDQTDTSVSFEAMLGAPEGATPCETAYAAIDAERSAAKLRGTRSIFQWVAEKPDFLAACQTLSDAQQKCFAPRYRRDHDDECLRARPDKATLAKMIVGLPVEEPKLEP
jgi:hypothetical protein